MMIVVELEVAGVVKVAIFGSSSCGSILLKKA